MAQKRKVAELYEEIFSLDPLLLLAETQRRFGDEILRNLLIFRPQATSSPHLIDVLLPVAKRAASAPAKPDASLVHKYHEAIRDRTGLEESDFRALADATMVIRGELTEERGKKHNFQYRSHQLARQSLKADKAEEAFDRRLKIATLGFRVKISKVQTPYLQEDLCPLPAFVDEVVPNTTESRLHDSHVARTVLRSKNVKADWEQAIVEHIACAVNRKADLILLPEFALPPSHNKQSTIVKNLEDELNKTTRDHFLFAGTRHEDRYNRGLVLKKEGNKISAEHWHYKRAPARGLGENVIGTPDTTVPTYATNITFQPTGTFTVGVAICYDTYDPTMFLSLVLESAYASKEYLPKILLVPAINTSQEFVALLRDLSFVARCSVIYVNGLHGDSEMFICGVRVSDLADKLTYVLQTLKDRRNHLKGQLEDEATLFLQEALKSPGHMRTQQQRAWRERIEDQLESVTELERILLLLAASGELNHMITIEDCDQCTGGTHTLPDHRCRRDILYYNLNKELISALQEFRASYFGNEEFLPKPFRRDELDAAWALGR
jgi:predicted amidohydrolase